jgi:hypothetical protein
MAQAFSETFDSEKALRFETVPKRWIADSCLNELAILLLRGGFSLSEVTKNFACQLRGCVMAHKFMSSNSQKARTGKEAKHFRGNGLMPRFVPMRVEREVKFYPTFGFQAGRQIQAGHAAAATVLEDDFLKLLFPSVEARQFRQFLSGESPVNLFLGGEIQQRELGPRSRAQLSRFFNLLDDDRPGNGNPLGISLNFLLQFSHVEHLPDLVQWNVSGALTSRSSDPMDQII